MEKDPKKIAADIDAGGVLRLNKRDRIRMWWRANLLQGSMNYERMQAIGWCYSIIPALEKLYHTKEDRAAALKRHLEFFNTQPACMAPILGVVATLEEERAAGADIDDAAINGVKIGMMGPLAGVGDPVFWGTLRPVIGAFAASLALSQSIMGPLVFFLLWNGIRLAFMWLTQELGYRQGANITADLSGGIMQKITTGASILGMFIMGVLIPRWTTMHFAPIVSTVKIAEGGYVDFAAIADKINSGAVAGGDLMKLMLDVTGGGLSLTPEKVTTLQSIFDTLVPGLGPLVLTFVCIWLLRRKVNPIVIILGLFVLGILGHVTGIMG